MPRKAKQLDKELLREWRKETERANKRLYRLEKLSQKKHYKNVMKYSYAKAQESIAQYNPNAKRFSRVEPKTQQELQERLSGIRDFLYNYKTTTKRDIDKVYVQRANTTNQRYGTNFTWEDMANYYESELSQQIAEKFKASKTVVKAIAEIKKYKDDESFIQAVENGATKNLKISDDKHVNDMVDKILKYAGKDLLDLF